MRGVMARCTAGVGSLGQPFRQRVLAVMRETKQRTLTLKASSFSYRLIRGHVRGFCCWVVVLWLLGAGSNLSVHIGGVDG